MLHHRPARTAKVAALLSATALSAIASPAFAQSYSEQSAGDITYTTGSLTGAPNALYLESSGGNLTTSVDTITATSTAQDYGTIVRLVTDGGSITGDFQSITATGAGNIFGIHASSNTGAINISVADMDLDGNRTFGVLAESGGAVSIDAGDVVMRGLTYDEIDFWTPDALVAVSTGSTSSITADRITINGLYSTAAAAIGLEGASVVVGDVVSNGTQGSVVYARSDEGDVLIDIGNLEVFNNNASIAGTATLGNMTVNVDTLSAQDAGAYGINVSGAQTVTIDAGAVVTDSFAINAVSTANSLADIDVRVYAAAVSATDKAIRLRGDDVALLIEGEETIVQGVGRAVEIEAAGTITLENQGTITGSGLDSLAVETRSTGEGATVINSNIVINEGDGGWGISANSNNGDITIVANETRTTGAISQQNTPDAIVAISTNGDVSITSGIATTEGLGGTSIAGISSGGDVTIVSDYSASGGDNGINLYGQGQNVSITASTVEMAGTGQSVYANAVNFADVHVGDINAANGASGVFARGNGVAQIVINGDVQATQYGALAISTGLTTVFVNGSVTSDASYGVASVGDQSSDLSVAEGASVTGATSGVFLRSYGPEAQSILFNSGTITGGTGYGVAFLGDAEAVVVNDGTIIGGEAGAVSGTIADDTVLTTENSRIVGIVDLGDGYDRLQLSQTEDEVVATGEVAQTVNVELLEVIEGSFRADTDMASSFEKIDIQELAELIVEVDTNGAAVTATNVDVDGRLVVEVADEINASITDLTANALTGVGTLVMDGEGVFVIDDGSLLQQEGGVAVESGTVFLSDMASYDGLVTTSGTGTFSLQEGDFTGDLVNNGTFVVERQTDYVFVGDFSGSGSFEKSGNSAIVFEGLYSFDGTTVVNGGSVALAGALDPTTEITLDAGTFDLSMVEGGEATILLLEGDGGTLVLEETDLVIDQAVDSSYDGDIVGDSTITKDGEGTLNLTGDLSFTGEFVVDEGKLAVNGDASGASVTVDAGGTLGGNGSVGDTTIAGGTLGAGNSIGHLTIVGDLVLTADSTFEVEVNDAGDADLVTVTGAADLGGSTLSVLAEDGDYAPLTTYTILTADGGVAGVFGDATSNFAFLTPVVTYNANDVMLTMARNDIDFVDLAATDNQAGVAGLISGLGFSSPLYYQTLLLSQGNVAANFETLTGEDYPALGSALVESGSMLARQLVPAAPAADGLFVWGKGLVNTVKADARSDWRASDLDGTGLAGGLGYAKSGFSISAGAGRIWQDSDAFDLDGLDMTLLAANLAYRAGGFNASAGVMVGNGDATLSRDTSLGTISETLEGAIDAKVTAISGEASYGFALGGATLSPYVGLSQVSVDLDDVQETGGVSALRITGLDRDVTFGDLGLRLDAAIGSGGWVMAHGGLRQAWGDRDAEARVAFAGSGTATIGAMPIDKTAVRLGLGGGLTTGSVSFSIGYDATLSDSLESHGGKVGLGVTF